ncbi:MAG: DUF262 domain-containing HNH endonuclease family protein [Pseudomonadota bacterium]
MTDYLTAKEVYLDELLKPSCFLSLPPYQRSYSWEAEEAGLLLDDLLLAMDKGRPHFVGAVVLVELGEGRCLIVDGQQRLTTLSIMIAALRDLEVDQQVKSNLSVMISDDPDDANADDKTFWRLTLNDLNRSFFCDRIQRPGATDLADILPPENESQIRMEENLAVYRERFSEMTDAARTAFANALGKLVILVRVTVSDWSDGYNVFRVLNTRGKGPSDHEIIKSNLLELADLPQPEINALSARWSEFEAEIGDANMNDLLLLITNIYAKSGKGPEGFRSGVLSKMTAENFLKEELPAYFRAYTMISSGKSTFDDPGGHITAHINYLRLIDHKVWRPVALKYLRHNSTKVDRVRDFFAKLERFAFVMMLVVTDTRARQKRYQRLLDSIGAQRGIFDRSERLKIDRFEVSQLRERLQNRIGAPRQRKAIALRLNAAVEGGYPLTPDHGATLEHVLPRNPEKGSYWDMTWLNINVRRDLCETVGNFVLLSERLNQSVDTLSFREKCEQYFADGQTVFPLTEDLRGRTSWTPDDVRQRSKDLADILMRDWGFKV